MAQKSDNKSTTKATRKSTQSRSSRRSRNGSGRRASQKTEKYRFAQNVEGEGTVAEREYQAYATGDNEMPTPDVLLDVPVIKVDRIHLELDQLDAHVALKAKVLDLLNLTVGVDAHLGKLRIDIEGVEAQALAKIRLDNVAAIVDRVLTTIDRNPDLVEGLSAAVEEVGTGAGHALDETGDAVEDVGEGAGEAVDQVGQGAGQAVGDIGQGAGQAVGQIGEGAGQAVGDIGEGAGQAVEGVGEGAGQAAGNLPETVQGLGQAAGDIGQGVGQVAGGAGQAAGQLGEGVGQAAGGAGEAVGEAGQAAGGLGQALGANGDGSGQGGGGQGGAGGLSAPGLAKEAVKVAAKQLGAVASDEAKDLSLAATRKVMQMGERRREKRADKHDATAAAMREAEDAGIDIEQIEGSGSGGRVTLRDVQRAAGG